MKIKLLILLIPFTLWNMVYANQPELEFFKIKDSYILYSNSKDSKVYMWIKLSGDDSQGVATSGGCDILFSGIMKNNIINGGTLKYNTDISQNSAINNIIAYKGEKSIIFNGDEVFSSCGLNVVYGDFLKVNKNSKYYDDVIKEITEDNLYDLKNNDNTNFDAYSNFISNLDCKSTARNVGDINDIGYLLEQKNYLKDANKILEKVIKCSPSRTVAYLNLGDTLSKQSKNKEAKIYYDQYKKMMIKQGLSKRIPKRILDLN